MNPITHFLAGWTISNIAELNRKERTVITLAGVVPDIDGLGIIAEKLTSASSHPLTWWSDYHHVLAHNVFFGLLFAAAFTPLAVKRRTVAVLALFSFHAHLLGDVVGGAGPDGEHWPIPYLWPLTKRIELVWAGQWAINAWQNFVITALLMIVAGALALRRGSSPVEVFSVDADAAFVAILGKWFGRG